MNHFNNYFKKGVVILVMIMIMLMSIPNMLVCSAVGSYKTYSTAIIANKFYKHPCCFAEKPPVWPIASTSAALVIAVAFAVGVGIASFVGAGAGTIGTVVAIKAAIKGTFPLISKYDEKDYQRHDFSKFDN